MTSRIDTGRRQFLLTSLAVSLGIPGCYRAVDIKTPGSSIPQAPVMANSSNVSYFQRHDEGYERYRQSFNKRIQRSPLIIAACRNEAGVQEAVRYANYQHLPVAVKSGGHSFEGFCLNDDGMVLDLSLMNTMSYAETDRQFVAEPGCKLGQVYTYLSKHKRLIPAGSCGTVGVAGLTLGGGYGFFSRRFGLTCDSLRSVRLVDAKGNVHLSENEPELLWACKGGGNGNFGVVTEFVFDTHPAPAHFTSYLYKYYNLDSRKASDLCQQWFGLMQSLPTSCYSAYILGKSALTILVTDTEESASAPLRAILAKLAASASRIYDVDKRPFIEAIQRYQGRAGPLYFKNVSAGYYDGFGDLQNIFIPMHEQMRKQPGMLLQINTLGGNINNIDEDENAAYPHRKAGFLGELQTYWEKPEQEARAIASTQGIQKLLLGNGINRHYRNYPDIDLDGWQQAYFGNNYPRLQALKQRLDAENRFQHPQSIELPR